MAQTRRHLAALAGARPHLVYISIVGVDRLRFGIVRGARSPGDGHVQHRVLAEIAWPQARG